MHLLHLLAGDRRAVAAPPSDAIERLVGDLVELLHLLALDVGLAGVAEDIGEPGHVDAAGDDFAHSVICCSSPVSSPLAPLIARCPSRM